MNLRYRINLVKSHRDAEKRLRKQRKTAGRLVFISFIALIAVAANTANRVYSMQKEVEAERRQVSRLRNELQQYRSTASPIDKDDIELLNTLLSRRIYWTRILDAMARHLPDVQPTSYWITRFEYRDGQRNYNVQGFGYISDRQEQLLELDSYLHRLRGDDNWKEVFTTTYMGPVRRQDETINRRVFERVGFEYSALRQGGRRR